MHVAPLDIEHGDVVRADRATRALGRGDGRLRHADGRGGRDRDRDRARPHVGALCDVALAENSHAPMVVAAALVSRKASGRTRSRSARSAAAAAADPALYWSDLAADGDHDAVMLADTADGRRIAVAFAGGVQVYGLAVHGGYLYYTDAARGVLTRCPCSACEVLARCSRGARSTSSHQVRTGRLVVVVMFSTGCQSACLLFVRLLACSPLCVEDHHCQRPRGADAHAV